MEGTDSDEKLMDQAVWGLFLYVAAVSENEHLTSASHLQLEEVLEQFKHLFNEPT